MPRGSPCHRRCHANCSAGTPKSGTYRTHGFPTTGGPKAHDEEDRGHLQFYTSIHLEHGRHHAEGTCVGEDAGDVDGRRQVELGPSDAVRTNLEWTMRPFTASTLRLYGTAVMALRTVAFEPGEGVCCGDIDGAEVHGGAAGI